MITKVVVIGIRFLFAICMLLSPAISAEAIKTPETGEMPLPMEAANCIGNINAVVPNPIWAAIPGTSGPKEKNAALPLPISIEDR